MKLLHYDLHMSDERLSSQKPFPRQVSFPSPSKIEGPNIQSSKGGDSSSLGEATPPAPVVHLLDAFHDVNMLDVP